MNIIIIEDEDAGAKHLANTLKQADAEIEILGICEDEQQTLDLLKDQKEVDAIFSDIQLTDALSFSVLKQINPKIPVVFVTAYNEYALEAFKHHGIDYVLKPFSRNDIETALNKLKTYKSGQQSIDDSSTLQRVLEHLEQRQAYKNTFLVGFQDRLIPIQTREIMAFYTEDSDSHVLHQSGKTYRINESLEQIEKQLDAKNFFRANRQFIVNKAFIFDIRHYFNGRLKVKLKKDTAGIIISKAKSTEFKNWLSL